MLNIFKKKPQGETVVFKIDGMHCTSCSMNIDGELEDVDGVIEAKTSYAKAKTEIVYDPTKVKIEKLKQVIESLEYSVLE
jgi:copper chaperone CopZ